MYLSSGPSFKKRDLYEKFDKKKINIPISIYRDKYEAQSLKDFCGDIFFYCVYLIILDIIQNNITFVLPTDCDEFCTIGTRMYEGELFEELYKRNIFDGIDFVASEMKGYNIVCTYYTKSKATREKRIVLSKNLRKMFYDNINSGKKYY